MSVAGSFHPDASLSGQVFQQVNAYRQQVGASQLVRHAGLDRLAQQHCEYLRDHRGTFGVYGKNVSHYGSEGRALAARQSYNMQNISENVAATAPGEKNAPSTLVKMWSDSKQHDYNLRSSWSYTGIGAVVDKDGTVFSTELFATANRSQLAMRDRFSSF